MNLLVRRYLSLIAPLMIGTLVILGDFNASTLAQELPPFEISVVPQAEYAVINHPFTYTVTVANVSQIPLNNTFVTIDIPTGTKFINTQHSSLKWYGGNAFADPSIEVEQITLYSLENIEPGETFKFDMLVKVLPEANQQIVVEDYQVTTLDGDILVSGLPVKTQVLTAAPSPTPLSSPTPTATPTSASSTAYRTPTPQTSANAASSIPQATESTQTDITTNVNADEAASTSTADNRTFELPSFPIIILIAIGSLLLLAAIGARWIFKKK
jgi:uncharacterized repeat protein (TIGR01451 family)